VRTGLARWEQSSGNTFGADYDPRQLGFDDALVSQFTQLQFPRFVLGTYQAIGSARLRNSGAFDTYTIQPKISIVRGRHFIKTGMELRRYNGNEQNPGMASGQYTFSRGWTQELATQATANSGNEIATFLLGFPTGAFVDRNIDPTLQNHYYAGFFQDDWKISNRLTLNFGVRWDFETPLKERYDRMLRGFGFDQASPLDSAAPGINLLGGVFFAGLDGQNRTVFEPDRNNFQPRVGAAYRIADKWVIRGGYGLYYLGQNEAGSHQGFSQRTNAIVSADGNLTPAVTLTNPFANLPGGRLIAPIGAGEGFGSFIGQNVGVNYLDRPLPYSHQLSFDIEHELPGGLLAEVAYVANLTQKFPVTIGNVNVLPASEMGRRNPDGSIDVAYYNERIPNPMAGLIPNNASSNGSTIPRQLLLRPYPHYGNISLQNVPIGRQRYDSAQLKLTKRYSSGLTFLASYTISKTLERANVYNNQDFNLSDAPSTHLERRSAGEIDIPQKFAIAGVWDLPVGRNMPLGANMGRVADFFLGGWQMNWNVT
jgi:hypothetical protein